MGGSMGMRARQHDTAIRESNLTGPVVNAYFRALDDGRTLFYPSGIFGRRGFVVASTEQEALLRASARGARKAGGVVILLNFLGLIAIGVFFTPSQHLAIWIYAGYVSVLLVAMWVYLRSCFRSITGTMESATVRNSPIAYWRSEGQAMQSSQLILRTLAVLGTGGAAIILAVYLNRPSWFVYSGCMAMWSIPLLFMVQGWWRGRR